MRTEFQAKSKQEAYGLAYEMAAEKSQVNGRCVMLVPSYDETVRAKHELAETGRGFGVTVATMATWVADLWEMFGDGRVIANSVDRTLFVRRALKAYVCTKREEGREPLLELTSGTEVLVEQLVRDASSEVIEASRRPEAYVLSDAQRDAVEVAAQVRRDMARAGLIEQARVCDKIREWGVADDVCVIAVGCETRLAEDRLLDAIGAAVVSVCEERGFADEREPELNDLLARLYEPDFANPIKAEGAVRFVYPAGVYASDQAIFDELNAVASAIDTRPLRVAIVAPDPLETFDALVPRLLSAGATVKVSSVAKFAATPFGRAWTALLEFVLDDKHVDVLRAGDYALSDFSSMTMSQAYSVDARFRGWRGQTVDDALTDLTAYADDDWREFTSLFAEGDLLGALDAQTRWIATRLGWPEAYRAQQLRAVSAAKGVHERCALLGLDDFDALEVLRRIAMPYEAMVESGEDEVVLFEVTIGTMAQLAQGPVAQYDVVVHENLDANSYPLKDEEASVDAVLQALDAWKPACRIEKLRLRFGQTLSMAKSCVILHRVLNDVDAEESRPAALLEELVDCYRSDPTNPDEVDKVTGLTESLQQWCRLKGEEELSTLLDPTGAPSPLDRVVDVYSTGYLAAGNTEGLLTPRRDENDELLDEVILSPSAIEAYLECPYKWFAQRRLRLESVDTDFGPIAFGSFAHKVLQALHDKLRLAGMHRVTPDSLGECDRLLDWQFDRLLEEEKGSYEKNALIPLTQLEKLEVENFRRLLHGYLRFEAKLLPDFEPWRHEIEFGKDEPFEYAGVRICGSIDRVDVDAGGRAVIIDYKQSVGDNYLFWPKDGNSEALVLPRKMQALIYAQVVRRLFGLVPVAAVYVAYGKNQGIGGLYDETILDPVNDLRGIKPDRCATTDMLGILDQCEAAVAERIAKLAQGEVAPCPCDEAACTYCPVVQCDTRNGLDAGKED